jgi:hypothetical protein
MSLAAVLFAKSPIPGRVKTRLSPPLSLRQAADFHRACVWDCWERVASLAASPYFYSDAPWGTPPPPAAPGQLRLQRGDDLGERMLNCFQELREQGHSGVLIVGSDSPSLPAAYLTEGLEALRKVDAVLGPADDGGYYAIGCREPDPRMFTGVSWSSPETMEETGKSLRALGWNVHELPPWYDVDTPDDLRRLAGEASLPPRVSGWLDEQRSLLA